PALASTAERLSRKILGETTLVRVGQFPKRILVYRPEPVYRPEEGIDTKRLGGIDILGRGSQFVSFGIHPGVGRPYYWLGDDPTNTLVESLVVVTADT